MPKCSMRPPIASTAAGITSRRSAIAEAPNTTTISAPALSTSSSALASALVSCGTRRSATIVAPAGASRSAVTFRVFSITLSASPGSTVETMPTLRTLNGATRTNGLRRAPPATAWSRASPDRERDDLHGRDHLAGDHRRVGRQRRKRDRRVDVVERVDAVRSTTSTPACSANRLARPVKARSTCTPSPATAAAISAAATSSETSPGSSRATTISDTLAASSAAISRLADQRALLEHHAALADRMHRDRAFGLARRDGAELHRASRLRAHSSARSRLRDLAHDGDRDLRRRHRADRQARSAHGCARVRVGAPCALQPLDPAGMRLLRAERADIEALALERVR